MKKMRRAAVRVMEIVLILLLGLFLFLSLQGDHPQGTPIREHIVSRGTEETGALNLVTAIYLGYRAFDTLGETIVLLLAVSGVLLFTERQE
jgi:multisubunit Na+/H+ antiporter MnhB subunit